MGPISKVEAAKVPSENRGNLKKWMTEKKIRKYKKIRKIDV